MTTYGIFVAYSPTAKIRAEGLGRYLASFVKAATDRGDAAFVIAAPSWSRQPLKDLFAEVGVDADRITFVGPEQRPISLLLYDLTRHLRRTASATAAALAGPAIQAPPSGISTTSPSGPCRHPEHRRPSSASASIWFCSVCSSCRSDGGCRRPCPRPRRAKGRGAAAPGASIAACGGGAACSTGPTSSGAIDLDRRLYDGLLSKEMQALVETVNLLDNVAAWYAPTSTLPAFNQIRAPKLMAFPDPRLPRVPRGLRGRRHRGDAYRRQGARDRVGRAELRHLQ